MRTANYYSNKGQYTTCRLVLSQSTLLILLLVNPRLVFVFSHETDITLRFFAGAVIRSLYLSGTRDDLLWVPDNTIHRSTFFRSLQEFPKDWIQSFYHYICEVQRSLSDGASERSVEVGGQPSLPMLMTAGSLLSI